MTYLQDAIACYLRLGSPEALCDICLANAIEEPRSSVNVAARSIGEQARFSRRRGICVGCEKKLTVTGFNQTIVTGKMTLRSPSADSPIRLHVTREIGADCPVLHIDLEGCSFELLVDPRMLKKLAQDALELLN